MSISIDQNIPAFFSFSMAKIADVTFLDEITYVSGAYYVFDRGYYDFSRWYRITKSNAWFVTRAKSSFRFNVKESAKNFEASTGVRCDQRITLKSKKAQSDYPEYLRRIRYYDDEHKVSYVFLTNNLSLPADKIAQIYKHRWKVELFFRWIKQHLRLRCFYGRSKNGVAIQVLSAICAFLLIAIAKKRFGLSQSLHEIKEVLEISIFEKIPISQLFMKKSPAKIEEAIPNQLEFKDF